MRFRIWLVLAMALLHSTVVAQDIGMTSTLEEARESGETITLNGRLGRRVVPEIYRVQRGDTLWDITGYYYGTPWQWPRVWSYNPEVTNPHWIYPDNLLRLRPLAEPGEIPFAVAESRRLPLATVWARNEAFLDREALEQAAVIVGSQEEHMLLGPHDEIYVSFEHMEDVRPGQEYQVFRRMESNERLDEEQGVLVRVFGTIQLRDYDDETRIGRAVVTEALDPIERGFKVANIPRSFQWVDPVRNDRGILARVVAAQRPWELPAQYQIVFVNAGSEHGVQIGNRFFIERAGDEWRRSWVRRRQDMGAVYRRPPEPDDYPLEIVAEGRVVHARPESATLLVIRSLREIEYGDVAEMRAGY